MSEAIEVFRAPFLPSDVNIEFEREIARVDLYLAELCKIMPLVTKLQACEVVPLLDRTKDTTDFVVLLRELRIVDLFSSIHRSHLFSSCYAFRNEVTAVRQAVANLPPLIASSLSAGITAASARELGEADDPATTIRRLFLRRRGLHVLSGYPRPPDTSTFPLFAHGVPATIRACVASIHMRRVKLSDVSLIGALNTELEGVELARSIWLTNIGVESSDHDALLLFRNCQNGKAIELEVVLAFDLAGGHIHSAEFRRSVGVTSSHSQ
jgi:hypothetical protein